MRVTNKASIRRLKPLAEAAVGARPGHPDLGVVLAQVPQRTRGTLAWMEAWN